MFSVILHWVCCPCDPLEPSSLPGGARPSPAEARGLRAVGRPLLSVRFPMRAIRGLTPSLASVCQGRALTGRR